MNKRGVVGIGTLIVFIAGILAAVIGSGVMLSTSSSLREEALKTSRGVRQSVTSFIFVEKIVGKDGTNNDLEEFEIVFKVGAGADPMSFNKTTVSFFTSDSNDVLEFGGNSKTAYFTNKQRDIEWDITSAQTRLKTDLDGDVVEDYVWVYNGTMLKFNLSTEADVNITIPNISTVGTTFTGQVYDINSSSSPSERYATLKITGTTTTSNVLDGGMNVVINPTINSTGRYSVWSLIRGKKYKEGAISFGDVTRVYLESSRSANENDQIVISVITQDGMPFTKKDLIPDVVTQHTVKIHP